MSKKIADILQNRLNKLEKNYLALKEYNTLIEKLSLDIDIFIPNNFEKLLPEQKAILDAYLKRFSSVQDFLGAKVFALLLDIAGISYNKMSEVLYHIEKEGIIDNFEEWIELREARNELEHDYPDELEDALEDLRFCVESFDRLERYYINSINFAKRYLK